MRSLFALSFASLVVALFGACSGSDSSQFACCTVNYPDGESYCACGATSTNDRETCTVTGTVESCGIDCSLSGETLFSGTGTWADSCSSAPAKPTCGYAGGPCCIIEPTCQSSACCDSANNECYDPGRACSTATSVCEGGEAYCSACGSVGEPCCEGAVCVAGACDGTTCR